MRFVKNYLKENLKWLLLVLACFGILCFVIGFEQVPLAQWGYAAFLCFFLYLLVVIIDFTRRYLHHKKLEKQTSEIAVTMDKLSLPRGQMETDYQKMLRSLYITLQQQAQCRNRRLNLVHPHGKIFCLLHLPVFQTVCEKYGFCDW